jgi:membrane protease subunit (stomatin/prohibitin family)
MRVIDAAGNPIIVRALLEFAVEDAAALHIATNDSLAVLFNMAEQVIRQTCTLLPLVGDHGADLRTSSQELSERMVANLQADASVFGVKVQRLVISEARYAPEIAGPMLMKQQAVAMVAARERIVAGALNIVRDTIREFPTMSEAGKERLISNMLVTLTSHTATTPTLPLS